MNEKIVSDPNNSKLLTERMNLHQKKIAVEAEKDYIVYAQELNQGEVLQIETEYNLLNARALAIETTINDTKKTLRRLNSGISKYKSFIATRSDVVMIGDQIMYVAEAKQISKDIDVTTDIAATVQLGILENMTKASEHASTEIYRSDKELMAINTKQKERDRSEFEAVKNRLKNNIYKV